MGTFTVRLFGMLAEKLQHREVEVPYAADTRALVENLYGDYPELKDLTFSLAVDKKIIKEVISLQGKEEIALLPPFSGG